MKENYRLPINSTSRIFIFEDDHWHYRDSYLSFSWSYDSTGNESKVCSIRGKYLKPNHGFSRFEKTLKGFGPSDKGILERVVQAFVDTGKKEGVGLTLISEEVYIALERKGEDEEDIFSGLNKGLGFKSYIDNPSMEGRVLVYEESSLNDNALGCPCLDIKDYHSLVSFTEKLLPLLMKEEIGKYEEYLDLLDAEYLTIYENIGRKGLL